MQRIEDRKSNKKPRNSQIDAMKGIAIFLVILGHTIQGNIIYFDNYPFFKIIYSFHMPLFFFLSGYIAYDSLKNKTSVKTIIKKFINLVIPFLSWYFIFGYFFTSQYKTIQIGDYFVEIIKSPGNGLWFLWVLFWCYIILLLFINVTKVFRFKTQIVIDIFFALLAILFLYKIVYLNILGLGLLTEHFPVFISAYIIAKYKNKFSYKLLTIIREISFIAFPILIIFWQRNSDPLFLQFIPNRLMPYTYYISLGYKYFVAFLGIALIYFIVKRINTTKIFCWIESIGRKSLVIYVLQGYLIIGVASIINQDLVLLNLIIFLFLSLVTLILSLAINKYILENSRILSFLFLGK